MGDMFQHRITESTGKISVGVWHFPSIGLGQKLVDLTVRRLMERLVRWIESNLNFSIECQAGKVSFPTANIQGRYR